MLPFDDVIITCDYRVHGEDQLHECPLQRNQLARSWVILSVISGSFRQITLSNIVGLSEGIIWLGVLANDAVEGEMGRY